MSVVPSDLIENINAQNMGQIFKMNPLTQEPFIQSTNNTPQVIIRGFPSVNRFMTVSLWLQTDVV